MYLAQINESFHSSHMQIVSRNHAEKIYFHEFMQKIYAFHAGMSFHAFTHKKYGFHEFTHKKYGFHEFTQEKRPITQSGRPMSSELF